MPEYPWISEDGDFYPMGYLWDNRCNIKIANTCGPYIIVRGLKLYAVGQSALDAVAQVHETIKLKKNICVLSGYEKKSHFLKRAIVRWNIETFGMDGKCEHPDTCLTHPLQNTTYRRIYGIDTHQLKCEQKCAREYDMTDYNIMEHKNWHVTVPKGYVMAYYDDDIVRRISFADLNDLINHPDRKSILKKMSDEDQEKFRAVLAE